MQIQDYSELPRLNEDPTWYNLIEGALCIWEHIIEATHADGGGNISRDGKKLYEWITQNQGVFYGREMAAQLARYVEIAYRVGNGTNEEYRLDGRAFDWEIIPFVIETWAEEIDQPNTIDETHAHAMGLRLAQHFAEVGSNDNDS